LSSRGASCPCDALCRMTNRKQDRRPRPWVGRALIESVRIESAKGTITAGCGCCSSPGSYLTNLPLFMGRSPRTAADRMRTEMIFGADIAELSGGRNTTAQGWNALPGEICRSDAAAGQCMYQRQQRAAHFRARTLGSSRCPWRQGECRRWGYRRRPAGSNACGSRPPAWDLVTGGAYLISIQRSGVLRNVSGGVGPSRACAWPMRGCAGCTPVPCWCRRRRRTPRRVVG